VGYNLCAKGLAQMSNASAYTPQTNDTDTLGGE
jgi:hypothetical protein